jgi:integrase
VARPRRTRRRYGSGTVYEKRPGQWVVSWREDGRRRYSEAFPSRDLAERVRARIEADRLSERTGVARDPASFPTLGTLGDDWLARHKGLLRSSGDDASRWKCHVRDWFGKFRPAAVDSAELRKFIEAKRRELDPATVGHCVKLLSRMYTDFCERPRETGVTTNPVRALPRSVRRLYRPTHDPRDTPFLESMDDAAKILDELDEPFRTMYAVGVFGMLRTGEILGLFAEDVDVPGQRITVRRQVQFGRIGPLKDDETRIVPLQRALLPFLAAQKLKVGGNGPLFPTTQPRGGGRARAPSRFISIHTLHARFAEAVTKAGRADVLEWAAPFYQSTRHAGASHWVIGGGSIERLALVMGHSSTEVTKRYAHLRPDHFAPEDYDRVSIGSRLAPGGKRGRAPKQRGRGLKLDT